MSNEFNLSFADAVAVAVGGGMVVGDGFSKGVMMVGDVDAEARLLHYDLETKEALTDTRVIVNLNTLNMKYKQINKLSELFD